MTLSKSLSKIVEETFSPTFSGLSLSSLLTVVVFLLVGCELCPNLGIQNFELDVRLVDFPQGIDDHVARELDVELPEPDHLRPVEAHGILHGQPGLPIQNGPNRVVNVNNYRSMIF